MNKIKSKITCTTDFDLGSITLILPSFDDVTNVSPSQLHDNECTMSSCRPVHFNPSVHTSIYTVVDRQITINREGLFSRLQIPDFDGFVTRSRGQNI